MTYQATIIVVEDEMLSRDMLARRLISRNFNVHSFATAQEALVHLENHPADLILMDNALPHMSGVEAVRLLRQHWSHDSLPILMVSAMIDSDDVVEALEAGANDYVIKPINFKVLLARVGTALKLKHNVAVLVEAERQRVMMESLALAAGNIAKPLAKLVDELESLMNDSRTDSPRHDGLEKLLNLTEQAVEVIEQLQKIAAMRDVPYDARVEYLTDLAPPSDENVK